LNVGKFHKNGNILKKSCFCQRLSGSNSEWWPNHRWSRSHASTT